MCECTLKVGLYSNAVSTEKNDFQINKYDYELSGPKSVEGESGINQPRRIFQRSPSQVLSGSKQSPVKQVALFYGQRPKIKGT